jgi:hypothetical protein
MDGAPQASTPAQPAAPGNFSSILSQATQYTVLAAFILYATGFIIWHAFLGTYGVSPLNFVETEYFSAAIIYIAVTVSLGLPPALLFHRWYNRLHHTSPDTAPKGDKISEIIFVWYAVSSQLIRVLFPGSGAASTWAFVVYIAAFAFFVIATAIAFYVYVQAFRLNTPEAIRRVEKFRKFDYITVFFVVFGLLNLITIPSLNKWFLFSTTILYASVTQGFGGYLPDLWRKSSTFARIALSILVCLIMAAHLQLFGIQQFGKIRRDVGGGKPETAYFKFSTNHTDLAKSLNIPVATNLPFLDAFYGPVSIIYKSDKEVLIVNEAEAALPTSLTNKMVQFIPTNGPVGLRTNFDFVVTTNPAGQIITNQNARIEPVFGPTNFMKISYGQVPNPVRLTAKQLRAELLDAIVYGK